MRLDEPRAEGRKVGLGKLGGEFYPPTDLSRQQLTGRKNTEPRGNEGESESDGERERKKGRKREACARSGSALVWVDATWDWDPPFRRDDPHLSVTSMPRCRCRNNFTWGANSNTRLCAEQLAFSRSFFIFHFSFFLASQLSW